MKSLTTLVFLCTLLLTMVSCQVSSSDARQMIIEEAGTHDVTPLPGYNYKFIVRMDDGSIWQYYFNGKTVKKTTLLGPSQ